MICIFSWRSVNGKRKTRRAKMRKMIFEADKLSSQGRHFRGTLIVKRRGAIERNLRVFLPSVFQGFNCFLTCLFSITPSHHCEFVEIEANKPVRKKIIEPKTPYHPMIDDDDGSLSPVGHGFNDCIADAMDAEEFKKTIGQSSGWTSSDDDDDPMEEDGSGMSFKEHRKAHYNEFLKVKELRQKGSFLEDEGDDVGGDSSSSLRSSAKGKEKDEGNATLPQRSSAGPANGL
ncbi:hypothetical protein ES319_A09G043800v1 [Gossypium barbadense]|uniref:Protein phosphatase inhibitor 2 n=1 Tax=Gossypium barbadense TaxID=3634 RepID=A0A5J5UAA0_GOSBA|nr:hypothetical protein ES319_A09G043800v1 [Gossypium barbadense]